jgi:hypothetical protein
MKDLYMKIASLIVLMVLGQALLAQERDMVPGTVTGDSARAAAGDSALMTTGDSTLMGAGDSTLMGIGDSIRNLAGEGIPDPAEMAPEETDPNPLISTDPPTDVPIQSVIQDMDEFREPNLVEYTSDFQFGDGIYANFDMVLANDPIPPARIVTDLDMFDRAFYEKITAGKEIVIYDENGVKEELPTHEIWGYGRNGILYINVGSAFHRISFVGSICHFVATVTTYNPNYYDPYYYNPYYSSSYYYNRYSMPQSNVASTDLRQYLLDFETGDVMEYDTESVEVLLMKDPELADEYHSLSNRKKKQMKFVYIRRYNEKHPLYLPER